MHKMRKLLLSLLLFPLALISCGNSRIYGHYSFQMGSDKTTHFGVVVDLINEDVVLQEEGEPAPTVKGKKFKFGMKFSEDLMPVITEEEAEHPEEHMEEIFLAVCMTLMNVEADPDAGLSGYFNISNDYVTDKGNRLLMTPIIDDSEEIIDIPVDFLQYFIIAFINKNQIDMVLPVSVEDVMYQLCWYGLYIHLSAIGTDDFIIDLINDERYAPMPGVQGDARFGTHPTLAEVIEMNVKYEALFEADDFVFRDFNTLSVGLIK